MLAVMLPSIDLVVALHVVMMISITLLIYVLGAKWAVGFAVFNLLAGAMGVAISGNAVNDMGTVHVIGSATALLIVAIFARGHQLRNRRAASAEEVG